VVRGFVVRGFVVRICGQDLWSDEDLWSDGTGTLLRVVNRPPFFRGSIEARTPQKDRHRPKAT